MTTFTSSSRRSSSILAALVAIIITVAVLGIMFGMLAAKVGGVMQERNDRINEQMANL